jgi:hypothetical protein
MIEGRYLLLPTLLPMSEDPVVMTWERVTQIRVANVLFPAIPWVNLVVNCSA